MSELVSVLIPAYNHEKYIQETIQSIINQTYKKIELIIIDDGSNDKTYEKILELENVCKQRFKRFVIKKQKNKGVCETLNNLIQLAEGQYIFHIASDDKAAPVAIKIFYDFLSINDQYSLAVGQNLIIDSESRECYWDKDRNNVYSKEEAIYVSFTDLLEKTIEQADFSSENFGSYESLLIGNYIPSGFLIRKSIYEKTGLYTNKAPLEDYFMNLQIAKYAKMKFIDYPTYYYRWHEKNTIRQSETIARYIKKTKDYEYKIAAKSKDDKAKVLVKKYKQSIYGRAVIYVPNILEIYGNIQNNQIVIELLGRRKFIKLKH